MQFNLYVQIDWLLILKAFHFYVLYSVIQMQILLLEALKANRCDYVRVLIDRGIDLQMIDLPELYEQVCCSSYLDHWFFLYLRYITCVQLFDLQTVSCQKCEFNKTDCLHMQWILKVCFQDCYKTD